MKGGKSKSETSSSKLSVTKKPAKGGGRGKAAAKDPNKPKRPCTETFMTQSPVQLPTSLPAWPNCDSGRVVRRRRTVPAKCRRCFVDLIVMTSVKDFSCPTCQLRQMLPPFPQSQQQPQPQPQPSQTFPHRDPRAETSYLVPVYRIDPTKRQIPCAKCQEMLNVPRGLTRFSCPQCHTKLAVDVLKLNRSLNSSQPTVNEEAIEVEIEEDEGGTAVSHEAGKQSVADVVDDGPLADWVKINVKETKDCFEIFALVPGLNLKEVRVQSDPAGRLVISGQPERLDDHWGITPFKKIVHLSRRIDPLHASAVMSVHSRLFIRVPFE